MNEAASWQLNDFITRFDQWVVRESPNADRQLVVFAWIHGLQTNPYNGAVRRLDLGVNFWFARVPGSEDFRDGVWDAVTCLYMIDHDTSELLCDFFSTLQFPIVG